MEQSAFDRIAEDYLARVEDPELDDKVDIPYPRNHEVAIAQLRVHYALLYPGSNLKSSARESSPPCISLEPMTDETVRELSGWLDDDKSNANAIGSITMPLYIAGIRLVRGQQFIAQVHELFKLTLAEALCGFHQLPGFFQEIWLRMGQILG